MSAPLYREKLKAKLAEAIDAEIGYLAARTGDPLDQMRLRQGTIAGLTRALDLADEAYKEIG